MKKILLILLSITIIVISFCGCSNDVYLNEKQDNIVLTTENVEQYLNFDLRGFGSNMRYENREYCYFDVNVNGTISGISGYKYNDVVLTIEYTFSYNDPYDIWEESITYNMTDTVSLNLGGGATVSATEAVNEYMHDLKCLGYTIKYVSGTVTETKA